MSGDAIAIGALVVMVAIFGVLGIVAERIGSKFHVGSLRVSAFTHESVGVGRSAFGPRAGGGVG